MKTHGKLLLMFCFALQLSCTQDIKEYDMATILDAKILSARKSPQQVKLQLCKEIPFKWNNIIVLSPYSGAEVIRKENLNNSRAITKMFPALTLHDGKSILLFIENNNIVRYASVLRMPLDFCALIRPGQESFKISKKMGCEQLYIKKIDSNLSLSY
jgi:hypothetical protein